VPTNQFTRGSTRTTMLARAGALRRWATRTNDERKRDMARVREGIIERYRAEAARLQPTASPGEIEEMARRLRYADNVKRAAQATEVRMSRQGLTPEKLVERVHHSATAFVDKLTAELPFPPEPTDAAGAVRWRAGIAKVVYGAVADEVALPHAERSFQRLRKRWDDYRLYLHSTVCPRQAPGTCPVCDEAVLP